MQSSRFFSFVTRGVAAAALIILFASSSALRAQEPAANRTPTAVQSRASGEPCATGRQVQTSTATRQKQIEGVTRVPLDAAGREGDEGREDRSGAGEDGDSDAVERGAPGSFSARGSSPARFCRGWDQRHWRSLIILAIVLHYSAGGVSLRVVSRFALSGCLMVAAAASWRRRLRRCGSTCPLSTSRARDAARRRSRW